MELVQILIVIFATSSGLVCIYSLVSSYLLYTSMTKLSKGEDFAKLVHSLFFTVLVGFVYSFWNLLVQLGLIEGSETIVSFISNLVIVIFFVMLAYLAFLTRQLSTKFGFRKVGEEITQYLSTTTKPKNKVKKI